MDDVIEKIGEILSDEESMAQLSELANMLSSGDGGEASDSGTTDGEGDNSGFPDMGTVMKIMGLVGSLSQSDKNAELLLALKPHLGEEKQKKVDKAVKLLKLFAVWSVAKESGLLNDLI